MWPNGRIDLGHTISPSRRTSALAARPKLSTRRAGEAVCAQAVQDGARKAGACRERGIAVQWIAISAQAVKQRLLRRGAIRDLVIGRARGHCVIHRFPEAARVNARLVWQMKPMNRVEKKQSANALVKIVAAPAEVFEFVGLGE